MYIYTYNIHVCVCICSFRFHVNGDALKINTRQVFFQFFNFVLCATIVYGSTYGIKNVFIEMYILAPFILVYRTSVCLNKTHRTIIRLTDK